LDKERIVGLQVPKARTGRDQSGDPNGGFQKNPAGLVGRIQCEEEKAKNGGEHLGDGFVFADFFGGEDNAFLAGHETDPRDEELACHDEGDEPDGKETGPEQADEGHHDEELVREGVKEAAEIRLDLPFPGEVAIEPVGESGGHEEDERQPGGPKRDGGVGTSLKKNEEDEGGADAGKGEPVGDSHFVSLS